MRGYCLAGSGGHAWKPGFTELKAALSELSCVLMVVG